MKKVLLKQTLFIVCLLFVFISVAQTKEHKAIKAKPAPTNVHNEIKSQIPTYKNKVLGTVKKAANTPKRVHDEIRASISAPKPINKKKTVKAKPSPTAIHLELKELLLNKQNNN